MAITEDEVRRIAALARLQLKDETIQDIARQLGRILEYVRQLQDIDTIGIDPTFHVLMNVHNVTRPDILQPSLPAEVALACAPAARDGMFQVPPVIIEEED